MIYSHNNLSIELLGDPHLGRTFTNGVPLHRRGEREAMMWKQFEDSVINTEADVHVCIGDLLDRWSVPYDVVYQVAEIYRRADARSMKRKGKGTLYVILRRNHDISLDLERRGAFDVFTQAVSSCLNIVVVDEPWVWQGLGFFPWHPTIPADELLMECTIVHGHYDTIFGQGNMIPTERMAELGIKRAYTGHVHKPERFIRDGVDVTVVGSMQPLAHGEDDPDDPDPLYITLSLDELDGRDLTNKCVRVKLAPGEVLDQEIDCLQLTVVRESEEAEDIAVTLGDFDMDALMKQAFEEENVPDHIRQAVLARFSEKRIAA
jgi:hypothetical protein